MTDLNKKPGKQIVAISTGSYRGVPIYDTPSGFAIVLGLVVHASYALSSITKLIDEWWKLKRN